jgi:hypothetical protein
MNEVNVRAVPVVGGWQGEIRKVHRADYEPVCVNGKPEVYPSEKDAEIAAWRALKEHLQADIVGTGDRVSAAKSRAEAEFGKVFPGRGRKPVVVERR